MKCRLVEHTADTGIEVEAGSPEELFSGAASGMFSLVVDPVTVSATVSRCVSLEAGDIEELMFKWLNELLFILDTERLLLSRFAVQKVDGLCVEATVEGEPIDLARHVPLTEIKAATYHQMLVERRGAFWFARVIFDV